MITQIYDLNLIPGGVPVRVPASQYDAGLRQIEFHLYQGAAPFSPPGGSTLLVEGIKPDRHGFSYRYEPSGDSSGNIFIISLKEQMTAVPGEVRCQLVIRQGDSVIGTAPFLLVVEPAALNDDVDISETEINSIEMWKKQSLAAAEAAEKSREQAADSAAAAKASAENAADHTHSAASITSGTLSTARLPTVPVSKGGSGKTSWTANRLLYPSSSTAFTQLAHPATAGSFLRQGTSGAPYWTTPLMVRTAIEAAPAGYGLGVVPESVTDPDTLWLPGFYSLSGGYSIPPLSFFGDNTAVVLVERAGVSIKQTVTLTSGSGQAIRWGSLIGSLLTFKNWEWETPPMDVDTEYRTTERFLGNTVYTKIIDAGMSVNGKNITTGIDKVIRYAGTIANLPIPYLESGGFTNGYAAWLSVNDGFVTLNINGFGSYQTYIQLWYLKD